MNKNKKSLLSSIGTAIFTKTLTAPLTRIKVLQQLQSFHKTNKYNHFFKSLQNIHLNEGFKGYFKGNMANIMKAIPNYCIKFPLNNFYITKIKKYKGQININYTDLLLAGVLTGFNQVIFTYPLDLIRTRITQDNTIIRKNLSITECFQKTIQNEGFLSLYKGLTPALLTTPIYIGIQLSTYQFLRKKDTIVSNSLIAGSLSGLLSQSLMYPGDTIKRHLQIDGMNKSKKYTNIKHCIQSIYQHQGLKGFYKGIFLNSIKSIPEVAIKFTIYDLLFNL